MVLETFSATFLSPSILKNGQNEELLYGRADSSIMRVYLKVVIMCV